jgi:hypothetical protein
MMKQPGYNGVENRSLHMSRNMETPFDEYLQIYSRNKWIHVSKDIYHMWTFPNCLGSTVPMMVNQHLQIFRNLINVLHLY